MSREREAAVQTSGIIVTEYEPKGKHKPLSPQMRKLIEEALDDEHRNGYDEGYEAGKELGLGVLIFGFVAGAAMTGAAWWLVSALT